VNLWQIANAATAKKTLSTGATKFMNLKYAPKLKQTTKAKLWWFALGQRFVNDIETDNFELTDDTMITTQKLLDRP
jgi:hypothetical protein